MALPKRSPSAATKRGATVVEQLAAPRWTLRQQDAIFCAYRVGPEAMLLGHTTRNVSLRWDGARLRRGPAMPQGAPVRSCAVDGERVWVGCTNGVLYTADLNLERFERVSLDATAPIDQIAIDASGRVWLFEVQRPLLVGTGGRFRRLARSGVPGFVAATGAGVFSSGVKTGVLHRWDDPRAGPRVAARAVCRAVAEGPSGTLVALGFDELLRSEDGGRRWKRQPVLERHSSVDTSLEALTFHPDGRVIVVGSRGDVLESRDDGRTFTRLEHPFGGIYRGALAMPDHVLVYGSRWQVLRIR